MAKRIYASKESSLVLLIPAAHCQSVPSQIPAATAYMLASTPTPAQRPSPNAQVSKDEAEIQACTLTMGIIKRMMQATEEMLLLPDANPLKNDDDRKAEQSLDQQTAGLAKRPEIVAVMGKFDFTPRTYTVAFDAYLSAAAAAGQLDAKDSQGSWLTKAHVNPANVALVRAHKKEIDELLQKHVYPHW